MPSLLHEALVALVRESPVFAADLLRDLLHVPLPAFTSASLSSDTIKTVLPVDYHADAVVLLGDGKTVFGIIVEAQLRPWAEKLFTWPLYAVTARAKHKCPFVLLVVTPDAATARWATQPIELGGGTWRPLVVGPDGVPVVTDLELAAREPHLAVLSVLAHGGDKDVATALAVAKAAIAGATGQPDATRLLYYAAIESALGDAARKTFAMLPEGHRFFSENQRRWFGEGEAKGKAEAILLVLEGRGLPVSADQRKGILACTDMATLDGWLKRAATVSSADQLFA
jgi:hypothetical protein